jgi:hypothetical protein
MLERSRQNQTSNIQPDVRFDGRHGVVLFDKSAEHRIYIPTLEAMLRRYLQFPESRAEVREWIEETHAYTPSAFRSLCEYLDLNEDYVRRALTRWMNNVDDGRLAATTASIHIKSLY